ncbi:hypothetical protein ACLOJK_027295, partial [Asimina triloba]
GYLQESGDPGYRLVVTPDVQVYSLPGRDTSGGVTLKERISSALWNWRVENGNAEAMIRSVVHYQDPIRHGHQDLEGHSMLCTQIGHETNTRSRMMFLGIRNAILGKQES